MATATLETIDCAVCGSTGSVPARVHVSRDTIAEAYGLPGSRSKWVVCTTCGLVFQSPRPDAAAVESLYVGGEYHDDRGGVPEHYIQYSLRRSVPALDWALDQLEIASGRALDIGCGIGGALVHLRDRAWQVTGVEPDPQLVQVGRERFGLDITQGFFSDDSFDDTEQFDLAYSCHVWEHLPDPLAVAIAARRRLEERGGHLFIVVPTFRQARTMAWACFSTPHTYMFTHVSLGNVLTQAGFTVVTHRYASDADSELWIIARADRAGVEPAAAVRENVGAVQRELATVPLRAPLGLPSRVAKHVRTLGADPLDFVRRSGRYAVRRIRRVTSKGG